MSFTKKMQKQGGHPTGLTGKMIGRLMNLLHGNIHQWGLLQCSIAENDVCLDIGCGGGVGVKELAKLAIQGQVFGLDHSSEMVTLSINLNRDLIDKELVKIDQGNVTSLPYQNNQFNLVTAFETIQFWPNLDKSIQEVKRVLKASGRFLIVNRYPPENSKWSDFLQIKNSKEYDSRLRSADFDLIDMDDKSKKGWICILAGHRSDR